MSVVEIIKHYQRSIDKCGGNEDRILHCITKLYHLPITVQHLQDTGIGRTVNSLRKYDGDCGEAAKACVAKWKAIVAAEESSDAETEEQQPVKESESIANLKQREDKKSKDRTDHSSSKKVKDEEKQKIKVENRVSNKYTDENKYVNTNNKDREENVNKNKNVTNNADIKKHRGDKNESTSQSSSSSKRIKTSSDSYSKHSDDKPNKSKSKHSSSEREMSQPKESKSHSSTGKKLKDHVEHSSYSNSKSSSDSKHSTSNSHKHSGSHSSSKKSKEDGKKSSSKKLLESDDAKPGKSNHNSPAKGLKRSCPELTEDSDDESVEMEKPNKSKSKKSNSSPSYSNNNSPSEDGSIDCLSGASFAEALGMISPEKRRSPTTSTKTTNKSASSSKTKVKKSMSSPMEFDFLSTSSPEIKLEPSDIELPEINPNYRPQPNAYNPFDSPPSKKCNLTEDVVLEQLMSKNSSKNQRMKVFSGVKTGGSWKAVPTLFEICVRVLQENIDALEYTGGIPYDILKPVLQQASPDQLFMLEHHNPYLLEDTDPLWAYHVNRHFRNKQRVEFETSREMYMRCLDEREEKFNNLKQSIKEAQAKSTPVRQTKMAYVDTNYVKPPRNVARQQAKNGVSARIVPKQAPGAAPSSATHRAPTRPVYVPPSVKQKPRMAPLMQKTMKFAKTFKR